MLVDHQPFTKAVILPNGNRFWIVRAGNLYYPYATRRTAMLGIVSPALDSLYSQEELKELYDQAPAMSDFV